MDDNSEKQLPLNKLKQIVKICGRVQKLLKMVAGFINSEENAMLKEFKNNLVWNREWYRFEASQTLTDWHLDISSCFINWLRKTIRCYEDLWQRTKAVFKTNWTKRSKGLHIMRARRWKKIDIVKFYNKELMIFPRFE